LLCDQNEGANAYQIFLDLLDPSLPPAIHTATLTTLLTSLLDAPSNTRTFESLDGLNVITSLLKSRSTSDEVRRAVLELLNFYLSPESPKSRPPSGSKTKEGVLGLAGRGREFSLAFEKAQRRQSLVSLPATATAGNSSLISADSSMLEGREGRNVSGEKKKIRSVEEKRSLLGKFLDRGFVDDLKGGGEGGFQMPAVAVE
jgi:hypothetical protein